jgi:PhzF family phenazine biosynthesis protein
MRIPYYRVSAFTSSPFGGNPAGVCPLDSWLPDDLMQAIAAENNLSETAFFVRQEDEDFRLRWFTPEIEVDLCGHATLASAFVIFTELGFARDEIRFQTKSGSLKAARQGSNIELDFPSRPPLPCPAEPAVSKALGIPPQEVLKSRDYLAVYDSAEKIAALKPDFQALAELDALGVIVTARGQGQVDFISRFFVPKAGIAEDPVTGSAHSTLIPFWAQRLGKTEFFARQISRRGGELHCRLMGDRVGIAGSAVLYSRGELLLP